MFRRAGFDSVADDPFDGQRDVDLHCLFDHPD